MINGIDSSGESSAPQAFRLVKGTAHNLKKDGSAFPEVVPQGEETQKNGAASHSSQGLGNEKDSDELKYLKIRLETEISSADSPPTEQQKASIRQLQQKISKIGGVAQAHVTSQNVDNIKKQEAEDEKAAEQEQQSSQPTVNGQSLAALSTELSTPEFIQGLEGSESGGLNQLRQNIANNSYKSFMRPKQMNSAKSFRA
ncbi:hypothetical protein [Salidesulfovibrio onnuriiensis]|uniref:hypothetical protein n=1 Tax=Salidesulfovibrio onnuriiensis TaxID=2583823 RepID=UPI0011C97F2C|nr:hypothetical protein [Salidesulfovibrio onnuriiensis]